MLKASIDIGSNSVLLLVMNGDLIVENEARITGLGRGIDSSKKFSIESMSETFDVLKSYQSIIIKHQLKPEQVVVTATEASRVVENAEGFFSDIKTKLGLNVQIISGDQEAYYSAKGVLSSDYDYSEVTIMDIGGASTELVKVKINPFEIIDSISMPIGAVRVTESYKQLDFIGETIKKYDLSRFRSDMLITTAGTMASLAAMMSNLKIYEDDKVHNSIFSLTQLTEFERDLNNYTISKIEEQYPMLGKRSRTIQAGCLLAKEVIEELGFKDYITSTRGLRFGVINGLTI